MQIRDFVLLNSEIGDLVLATIPFVERGKMANKLQLMRVMVGEIPQEENNEA